MSIDVLIPFRKSGRENKNTRTSIQKASVLIPFRKSGRENTRRDACQKKLTVLIPFRKSGRENKDCRRFEGKAGS